MEAGESTDRIGFYLGADDVDADRQGLFDVLGGSDL
jgi:hypothetical protein